ncbi:unnamed protein product, partial [Darwinula stevensoni]
MERRLGVLFSHGFSARNTSQIRRIRPRTPQSRRPVFASVRVRNEDADVDRTTPGTPDSRRRPFDEKIDTFSPPSFPRREGREGRKEREGRERHRLPFCSRSDPKGSRNARTSISDRWKSSSSLFVPCRLSRRGRAPFDAFDPYATDRREEHPNRSGPIRTSTSFVRRVCPKAVALGSSASRPKYSQRVRSLPVLVRYSRAENDARSPRDERFRASFVEIRRAISTTGRSVRSRRRSARDRDGHV